MAVTRLKRSAINDARWDDCVASDERPMPYGLSWWLDAVTDGSWDGLVIDDYRAVLPLPRLRAHRIVPAFLRPPFTQQLGPFGTVFPGDLQHLLQAVPFRPVISLPLSRSVSERELPPNYTVQRRTNFVLHLDRPFDTTAKQFPKTVRSLIRRSENEQFSTADPAETIYYYRRHLAGRGGMRDFHFDRLAELIETCIDRGCGNCYQAHLDGELAAIGFFPTYNERTINLTAASTVFGMKCRGMTRLLLHLWREASGRQNACFDFEGSELPGVRQYFAKFGGVDEGYYLIEKRLVRA